MLMLTPDVLSQVSPFCSNVWTELATGTRPLCFTLSCFFKPVLFGDWVNFYQPPHTLPYSPALTMSILGIWIIRQPNFHKKENSV